MAKNPKHYSCDYCGKQGLEYNDVDSVYVKTYVHGHKDAIVGEHNTADFDICKPCVESLFKTKDKSLISTLNSIWLKIT